MNNKVSILRTLVTAPTFSPLGMVARALVVVLVFLLCHSLGWREHTTFISGSEVAVDADRGLSILGGVAYMAAYFGAVLLSPILLLAGFVLKLWNNVVPKD
jgi:hypothetical protein